MDSLLRGLVRIRSRLPSRMQFGGLIHSGCLISNSSNLKSKRDGVAIFWDLDSKPPISCPPYDAAVRLKLAASEFGVVRYMAAFANRLPSKPTDFRQLRMGKELDILEINGIANLKDPYICQVCGRKFKTNMKLVNHFKKLHGREQTKRINRLNSYKGKKRVEMAGKMEAKIEKYRSAAREILTPKVGYGFSSEIKRAGFWVRTIADNPRAADMAIRGRVAEMVEHGLKCLVLVSDDSNFVDVLEAARYGSVKTVVIGDGVDGALQRCAEVNFSWAEILRDKSGTEAMPADSCWRDHEMSNKPKRIYAPELMQTDLDDFELVIDEECENLVTEKGKRFPTKPELEPWWKLD